MNIIFELGAVIGIAAVIALIARAVKQPPIIAYLLTGVIVGPLFLNVLSSTELIETFAHLGVAFLLFIVGLSLDFVPNTILGNENWPLIIELNSNVYKRIKYQRH